MSTVSATSAVSERASTLYTPIKIGAIECKNRIIMAPLTRCRANNSVEHKVTDMMVEYYTQRATAGLIIVECSSILPHTSAFYTEPGIYEDTQIEGWKKLTDSIHAAGGRCVLQIWHGGRACPAEYNNGIQPVGPSPVAISHRYTSVLTKELTPNDVPREMTDDEAREIIKAFAAAAKRAVFDAGFDGVEIHGANGYLISQFLTTHGNKRPSSSYFSGESSQTRARFALEVVDAVAAAVGKDRVGIRFSPHVVYNDAMWENPKEDAAYISTELNKRGIAYIHVERREYLRATNVDTRDLTLDATPSFRAHFDGIIISNTDFEREEAEAYVEEGEEEADSTTENKTKKKAARADAVAIGSLFIPNPDLVRRFREKRDSDRNPYRKEFYYQGGTTGYTDYPFLADAPAA